MTLNINKSFCLVIISNFNTYLTEVVVVFTYLEVLLADILKIFFINTNHMYII